MAFICIGPSAYNISGSFLRRTSSPSILKGGSRFGDTSARIAAGLPGPGQYSVPTSVGCHPMSTKPNKPVVGFPKAHRDASRKVGLLKGKCSFMNIALQVY